MQSLQKKEGSSLLLTYSFLTCLLVLLPLCKYATLHYQTKEDTPQTLQLRVFLRVFPIAWVDLGHKGRQEGETHTFVHHLLTCEFLSPNQCPWGFMLGIALKLMTFCCNTKNRVWNYKGDVFNPVLLSRRHFFVGSLAKVETIHWKMKKKWGSRP